jgi:Ni/Co efflux regulator RcnB
MSGNKENSRMKRDTWWFRSGLLSAVVLASFLAPASAFAQGPSDDDRPRKRRADDDDDRPKKRRDDDDDRPRKRRADDDDDRPKKRRADDEDDAPRRRRSDEAGSRKRGEEDDDGRKEEEWRTEPLRTSLSLERVGGFSYAAAAPNEGDSSASLSILSIGGTILNPYASPRLGLDVPSGNLTFGGSASFSRSSIGASSGGTSSDLGSLTIYTLTPRVGYVLRLSPAVRLSLRFGLVLAGGSVSLGDGGSQYSVFATGLDAEGVGFFRVTDSFHILTGLSFDRTLSASVSQSSDSSGSSSSSSSSDIKGALFTIHGWLGLGGYLLDPGSHPAWRIAERNRNYLLM